MKYLFLSALALSISFVTFSMDEPAQNSCQKPARDLQKICLKKLLQGCITQEQIKKTSDNTTFGVQALYSPNGKYFIENVSTTLNQSQINVWHSPDKKIIKTFQFYANHWQFDPRNSYVIFYTKTRLDRDYLPAFLYSLTHNREIPLCNDTLIKANMKLGTSSNGQFIAYSFVKENYENTTLVLDYSHHLDTLHEIPQGSNNMSDVWAFCSGSKDLGADQHILYISKDGKSLIKQKLPYNILLSHPLTKKYTNMYVNKSLITLQSNKEIELLEMTSPYDIVPLRTIITDIYDSSKINILPIHWKQIIAHQYTNDSFSMLDNRYNKIGSYTLKNDKIPAIGAILKNLITNQKSSGLIAHYDYSEARTRSSIIFFDLSSINTKMTAIRKDFNQKINTIQFINNDFLLIQGRKSYIFDTQGNKITDLGECQSAIADSNSPSILHINQTPFFGYNHALGGYGEIPTKTKIILSTIDEKALLELSKNLKTIAS